MFELKPERFGMGDFNTQPITICGKSFIADQSGALYWPGEKALIIADLHLEKGSSYAARGQFLPPYDTRATLLRLAETIDRFDVATVIALGDSIHDEGAADRIAADDLDILHILQDERRWIWVTGNHDPVLSNAFGGDVADELELEGLALRHVPRRARVTHEIAGHMHPAGKLSLHGSALRRPCFVGNGLRLILPAFGAYAGGLNVLDDAFGPLFGDDGVSVWMLGQEGLYPVATRQLRGD